MSGYTTDSLCPATVQVDMHATCDGYIDCHFDGVYNHVGDKSLATSVRIVNICGEIHPEGRHTVRELGSASHSGASTSLC